MKPLTATQRARLTTILTGWNEHLSGDFFTEKPITNRGWLVLEKHEPMPYGQICFTVCACGWCKYYENDRGLKLFIDELCSFCDTDIKKGRPLSDPSAAEYFELPITEGA
jgi:hypothetical protein